MSTAAPLVSNLSELLTKQVEEQPEHIAVGLSDLGTTITYRQLDALVRSVMLQLSRLGLKRGETVAMVSDNSLEFVLGFLAIVSLGARVAPLNSALKLNELRTRLAQLAARAVIIPQHLASKLFLESGVHETLWLMEVDGSGSTCQVRIAEQKVESVEPGSVLKTDVSIDSDDVALLMFTGGTTGAPKLVPLTHRNIIASIRNISSGYALSPSDATLIVMPMFHGHGLMAGLLSTLASGGSAYLPSTGGFSAHLFWQDMVRVRATWYTAVPTIHRILLNRASKEYPESSPPELRFIRSCSAPLDEELAANVAATFHAPLISAYGMTEASHQVSSMPLRADAVDRGLSVGLATGIEIRVVDQDREDVVTGSFGEIWIRGATVTAGYLNNPEANSTSFVDGWFRTGDIGSRDADGYIFVKGRLKEMINRGGEKIAPSDIDAAMLSNPKVLEAASFGEADALYGENVQAAVILRPGVQATEDELRDYSRMWLSAFEVPEHIHIIAKFPRTAKGSTDRHALAAQFAGSDK